MKIDRLETHDRYKEFLNQNTSISECCQDLINKAPFGIRPFYIFAHARTIGMDERFKLWSSGQFGDFENVPEKTIIWQPRLTRPEPQINSMLFKAHPGTDIINIIWMIPQKELWNQYKKGNMTESCIVFNSIWNFLNNKGALEKPDDDDPSDEEATAIYRDIAIEAKRSKLMDRWATPLI